MTISIVGSLPIAVLSADAVDRVAGDLDLWNVAEVLVKADVGAHAGGTGDEVSGNVSERDLVGALAGRRVPSTTTAVDLARGRVQQRAGMTGRGGDT